MYIYGNTMCIYIQAGMAQLLSADKLFDNLYHSLGLHLVTDCLVSVLYVLCVDCEEGKITLTE